MESLQGQFLIAAPTLVDPNFHRAVVFMVQHSEEGALGLIVNRPTNVSLAEAWGKVSQSPCTVEQTLHQGGPCEGVLMVLHTDDGLSQVEVLPGLHFCAEPEQVERLVAGHDGPMKFFVGYSGWGPGQLESELEAGGWLVRQAEPGEVLDTPGELWHQLIRQIGRETAYRQMNPRIVPEDPSMN